MAIRLSDIQSVLEEFAPIEAAEKWDNSGLLLGRSDKEVNRVYVSLDATRDVLERVVSTGADMLLTHHPLIFNKLSSITDLTGQGSKLMDFIIEDISVYSMHTNFDSCPGGMGDLVCVTLGLENLGPMARGAYQEENSYVREHKFKKGLTSVDFNYGLGFVSELANPMTCEEFARLVKEKFNLPHIIIYDAGKKIRRIACCPGSGKGEFELVKSLSVDAFLTGDMGHHDGLDYNEEGISLIDAGHYGLEHVFVHYMADFLRDKFPSLDVIEDELHFPSLVL